LTSLFERAIVAGKAGRDLSLNFSLASSPEAITVSSITYKRLAALRTTATDRRMSFSALAGGADCGPVNPLAQLSKTFAHDRGAQQVSPPVCAMLPGLDRRKADKDRNSSSL